MVWQSNIKFLIGLTSLMFLA
uniref:Uncharacterized protein n=1 Tax=Rhizophora mucronata TaxID=61149 RepID=A0A2P2N8H5_RHIMU